jgi:hypothetical protein
MCPHIEEEADWDDEGWDADPSDAEGDEDEPTIPCPCCRREIHEESPRCPYCGHYISEEDVSAGRKPWWIVIGILLGLLAIWTWIAQKP